MLSLSAVLRLSGQYWLAAGRLTVVVLLVWLSADQPAPGPTDLWMSGVMGSGVKSCSAFRPLFAMAIALKEGDGQPAESSVSLPAMAAVAKQPMRAWRVCLHQSGNCNLGLARPANYPPRSNGCDSLTRCCPRWCLMIARVSSHSLALTFAQ